MLSSVDVERLEEYFAVVSDNEVEELLLKLQGVLTTQEMPKECCHVKPAHLKRFFTVLASCAETAF